MSAEIFHIVTHWRVVGTIAEVVAVLEDPRDLPRWWPAVYLAVTQVAPGGENSVGAEYDLFTKGYLPYTLRWRLRVKDVIPNERSHVEAVGGDLVGEGIWKFSQNGQDVDIEYDWKVRAEKPVLKRWLFLLGPVFAANHRWAMRRGGESLALELLRRRAKTAEALAAVPAPPAPTFRSWLPSPQ